MATEETTITELELAEEVLADMVIPVDTSTDTKSVSLKQLRAWLGSSLPTGFILPAVGKIDDERFTLLDGKTLSKQGTYGAFCTKVEEQVQGGNWFACSEEEYNADLLAYGQCGKFVIGTDYVRIPKITRFIGATITLSEIGRTYKESLPQHTHTRGSMNITGSIAGDPSNATGSGALYVTTGTSVKGLAGASGAHAEYIAFDASRNWTGSTSNASGSTYQSNAKVQPDHTKFPYYMVISTEGQTAEVEIDINKVYEDMNLKANSDFSNVSANIDYIVENYENGFNWYQKYKSGKIIQGGRIKAPVAIPVTINLIKPFANTNYTFLVMGMGFTATSHYAIGETRGTSRTKTSIQITSQYGDTQYNSIDWVAYGKGA